MYFIHFFELIRDPNQPDRLDVEWKAISSENPAIFYRILPTPSMQDSFHWDAYKLHDGLFNQIKPYITAASTSAAAASISEISYIAVKMVQFLLAYTTFVLSFLS